MPSRTILERQEAEPSDEHLVGLLQAGQSYALNELMRRYKGRLYIFVMRYLNDAEAAQDVLQETFARVFFKAAQFKPEFKFSTWVYTIAMNLCRDHGRRARLARFIPFAAPHDGETEPVELIPDSLDVERDIGARKELQHLVRGIAQLPHKLRTAMILIGLEGHSLKTSAALLNVTEKTVEMRVYRARKHLQAWMQRRIADD